MEPGIHISQKSKLRSGKAKDKKETKTLSIEKAHYLGGFNILVFFFFLVQKRIDFLPIFSKHVTGDFSEYATPSVFKKFIVENGNIYWGKNEDIIFPVSFYTILPMPGGKKRKSCMFFNSKCIRFAGKPYTFHFYTFKMNTCYRR